MFSRKMMRPRIVHALLLSVLLLTSTVPAWADGEWYTGAAIGAQHLMFEPRYTSVGSPPQQFDDPATGPQVNIFVGQRFGASGRLSIGWQAKAGLNGFGFSLSLPSEPAELRYTMPASLVLSAVPEVRLGAGVSVFGTVGGGGARVREHKTSPSSSAYDYRAFEGARAWGGGVRLGAGGRFDVLVQYEDLKTSTFAYDTFTAAGIKVEHVEDATRSKSVLLGGAVRF
jgi:hypothetical protein